MNYQEEIRDRVRLTIIEEIQRSNLLSQKEPENYIPIFIEALTNHLSEMVLDEISFKLRR